MQSTSYMTVNAPVVPALMAVQDYLSSHPGQDQLIGSGLIDEVLRDTFTLIDDPVAALGELIAGFGKRYDSVYLATSTWSLTPEEAIRINTLLASVVKDDGNIRHLGGKGCNTFIDAVLLAHQCILAGQAEEILVINLEINGTSNHRLQNYAFFSDVCIAAEVAANAGDHRIIMGESWLGSYLEDSFSNQNNLSLKRPVQAGLCPARVKEITDGKLTVWTLNSFDFVQRFKYESGALFKNISRSSTRVHQFGADPFLPLVNGEQDQIALIHVESPPRHVTQLLVAPAKRWN